jgi:hypothetical protein
MKYYDENMTWDYFLLLNFIINLEKSSIFKVNNREVVEKKIIINNPE